MQTTHATEATRPQLSPPRDTGGAYWRSPTFAPLCWILVTAVITASLVASGSSFYLFTWNSCLLASFGALALNLLMGTAGLVSIGNSAFLAVGAFASVFMIRAGVPFPVDVIVAAFVSALVGVVIGLPALRLRGLHLALSTLAAFFIVTYVASQYQSHTPEASSGFTLAPLYQSKGLAGGQVYWAWTLLILLSVVIVGAARLAHERSGRAWRMIRDHESIAQTMGIAVTRYKMSAFAISSAVIGFQGGLLAHFTGSVSVDQFTLAQAIAYVAMVLIGGLDSVAGALIGAWLVTALPTIVPKVIALVTPETNSTYAPAISQIVYGGLVIIFITSSPQGLVGLSKRVVRWARSTTTRSAPPSAHLDTT